MDFFYYWAEIRSRLDQELMRQIPMLFSELDPEQAQTVQRIIQGGKRIRGCLVCLVCQALGGRDEDAMPRAVAIECVQAASLIHDDYVDNDMIRRESPAVWTVEGPRRAVLLGDVMFATAIQSMVELSSDDGRVVTHAIATIANGAYQEIFWLQNTTGETISNKNEENIYERIIHLKTGALFGAACQLGAIAAGASQETAHLAYTFGARTGEAYQIADDLTEFTAACNCSPGQIEKLQPLLPALKFFCSKAGADIPYNPTDQRLEFCNWCQYIGKNFMCHMREEINLRVHLAESYIDEFPKSRYCQILGEAPAEIVSMMSCYSDQNASNQA